MRTVDWPDVVRAALSFFLVASGCGIAYLCVRLGNTFGSLSRTVRVMTDETLPILTNAQVTVEKVNLQLGHVDEIMLSAVGVTKGAERVAGSVAGAVATPVRKASGLAAKAQQQLQTFKSRRAAREHDALGGAVAAPETLGGAGKILKDALAAVKQAVSSGAESEWAVPVPAASESARTAVATASAAAREKAPAASNKGRRVELPYPAAVHNGAAGGSS